MALDNANFIAELSITDPPGSDPLSQGDDQIRTIKRATFQSFPLIAAAVNLTDAQLNLAAIKNEANVFTVTQNTFSQQVNIRKDSSSNLAGHFYQDATAITRWGWFMSTAGNLENMQLQRRDALGAVIDVPFVVRLADGVAEFLVPPEINGAPLWVAGEIRTFVASVVPGTNWFSADGTNGTVNLIGRYLQMNDGFSTDFTALNAGLVGTAVAGTTGSTAISAAQMPVHTHRIWSGNQSGISDTTFAHAATQTVAAANRGNTGPAFATNNSIGQQIIENSGSGSGHTHSKAAAALAVTNPTFSDAVRPLTRLVEYFQYVP